MVALQVLGLNCGTSVDGIDIALCRISSIRSSADVKIELLSYTEIPVDAKIRSQVLNLCRPGAATTLSEVCDLNFALGRQFTKAIADAGVDLDEVDIIASHGQTLWHSPNGDDRSTLQMAEPAVIAQQTKKTVVSGFRVAELAVGRQGAPLAGFFEACLLGTKGVNRISQNIGGIGNATFIPALDGAAQEKIGATYTAFDTGPGNVLIDAAVRILSKGEHHYDKDGAAGARGESEIDARAVEEYLNSEPYFDRSLPKTTGRELFSDDLARALVERLQHSGLSPDGIIATITRITSESIVRAYTSFIQPVLREGEIIDEIYICGGGAYNPNILKHLQARLPQSRILKLDHAPMKLDPAAKEAIMFALMGFLCVCGRTVPIAGFSESSEPVISGSITPGPNYWQIMGKVSQRTSSATLGRIIM